MARVQTIVQLNGDLLGLLDREAARRGISRSALIRGVLEDFLGHDAERDIAQRIVEGYRRLPPGTPDGWGDVEEIGDRTAADLARRLDAEERDQGHGPW